MVMSDDGCAYSTLGSALQYKVPASSDRMTEIARTIKYCRDALA
jgi:hypothetical protein